MNEFCPRYSSVDPVEQPDDQLPRPAERATKIHGLGEILVVHNRGHGRLSDRKKVRKWPEECNQADAVALVGSGLLDPPHLPQHLTLQHFMLQLAPTRPGHPCSPFWAPAGTRSTMWLHRARGNLLMAAREEGSGSRGIPCPAALAVDWGGIPNCAMAASWPEKETQPGTNREPTMQVMR